MDPEELQKMVLVANIYHCLQQLTPEGIEAWRTVSMEMCSQDAGTQNFIQMAARLAVPYAG